MDRLEEVEVAELVAVDRVQAVVPRARRVVLRPAARRRNGRPVGGVRPVRHARTLRRPRKPSIRMNQRTVCVIRSPSVR